MTITLNAEGSDSHVVSFDPGSAISMASMSNMFFKGAITGSIILKGISPLMTWAKKDNDGSWTVNMHGKCNISMQGGFVDKVIEHNVLAIPSGVKLKEVLLIAKLVRSLKHLSSPGINYTITVTK